MRRDFKYFYDNKEIPYNIWFSDDSPTVDAVVFLGTVQVGKLPQWVAEQCPPKTAVIQGAPHWHAKEDGSDIPKYMFHYTESAFKSIIGCRSVKQLSIIADSQAAPGVIRLFSLDKYRSYMKIMVLLQPLGLTATIYDDTDKHRMALFKKRILQNRYHQLSSLLLDRRLRYNHRLLNKMVNFKDTKATMQYSSGLRYNSLPDLQKLLQYSSNVKIVCGGNDRIFPASEIEANLRRNDMAIDVVSVRGVPHSPLATKQGTRLLNKAFEISIP